MNQRGSWVGLGWVRRFHTFLWAGLVQKISAGLRNICNVIRNWVGLGQMTILSAWVGLQKMLPWPSRMCTICILIDNLNMQFYCLRLMSSTQ